jgi:hypothetical protein
MSVITAKKKIKIKDMICQIGSVPKCPRKISNAGIAKKMPGRTGED